MPRVGLPRRVTLTGWRGAALSAGTDQGADWTSPVVESDVAATALVPSWNAATPPGTWVEILLRVRCAESPADWSPWFELGRWASDLPPDGGAIERTSVTGQRTAYGVVDVDTLRAGERGGFTAWQLRVRRHGPATVRYAAVVASAGDAEIEHATRAVDGEILLDVPPLSQHVHRGHYPRWDGGGASWCAATSLAMVLRFHGTGPTPTDLGWVTPGVDAEVDHAARGTFDAAYGGCGNWPFGVAYAAGFGLDGHVTRLTSLAQAEEFIAAGLPLIASVRFGEGELAGAGYATEGHLLVVVGFTADGDVVCNDPASRGVADNAQVRINYNRSEFARAWAGGVTYVLRPGG